MFDDRDRQHWQDFDFGDTELEFIRRLYRKKIYLFVRLSYTPGPISVASLDVDLFSLTSLLASVRLSLIILLCCPTSHVFVPHHTPSFSPSHFTCGASAR
jgi:hypothetical protein